MLGPEPGSTASSFRKLAKSRPGSDEQDEGEPDLHDDESAAYETRAPACRSRAAVVAQDEVEVEAGELRERHGADDESLHEGQTRS